jgi:hypothetical protein
VRLEPTYVLFQLIKRTVQFIAVYANTSVQFDEGTPLLPNLVKARTIVCKTTPLYNSFITYVWYFDKITTFWKFGKSLLLVYKHKWQKMISSQTAVDLIATQCGGPDIIYVSFKGLTWRNTLFTWVQTFLTLAS